MRARTWIASALSLLMVGLAVPAVVPATAATNATTTINVFDDGDTNIQQLFLNLGAQYHKLHPNINVNVIFNQHGLDDNSIYSRLAASAQAGKPAPFDITDGSFFSKGAAAGLWVKLGTKAVPNLKLVNPTLIRDNLYMAAPYRGSEVVLAYNSATVKNPPHTLAGLVNWIKANPGQFDYCNPSDGGSGDAFVQAMLSMGLPKATLTALQNPNKYTASIESAWTKNLQNLAALGKDIYRHGYYPPGNTNVLNLLAQGAIQMATVWSDQSTAALKAGQLPKTVKLLQLKTPFYGGAVPLYVVKNSPHVAAAEAFLNWILAPKQQLFIMNSVSGFPGIEWKYLPAKARAQFASVEAPYFPGFAGQYDSDLHTDWQKVVAGASSNG